MLCKYASFCYPMPLFLPRKITFTRAENGVDDAVLFVERPFGVVDVAPWTHVLLLAPGLIARCA